MTAARGFWIRVDPTKIGKGKDDPTYAGHFSVVTAKDEQRRFGVPERVGHSPKPRSKSNTGRLNFKVDGTTLDGEPYAFIGIKGEAYPLSEDPFRPEQPSTFYVDVGPMTEYEAGTLKEFCATNKFEYATVRNGDGINCVEILYRLAHFTYGKPPFPYKENWRPQDIAHYFKTWYGVGRAEFARRDGAGVGPRR